MVDHVSHPDRINYPLKRKGGKRSGQWQRLTWNQAFKEIADKLGDLREQYGAETLAFTHGTKRTYLQDHWR
jgi:thiosulfate reductase/polysulfide reductase chain A